jgi:hypothetical protein
MNSKYNRLLFITVISSIILFVTAFAKNEVSVYEVKVTNKSSFDYMVCVYCYGQQEGSFKLSYATSTSINVPCTSSNLSIKYGTYGCNSTAYSSGYNSYVLN